MSKNKNNNNQSNKKGQVPINYADKERIEKTYKSFKVL